MERSVAQKQPLDRQSATNGNRLRHTYRFLIAFYVLATTWGARNIRYWEPSALDILVPVALAVALGWWAVVDARRRGHSIPLLVQPWFVLLAGLVVPGYVIWSRRLRGAGWVVVHAALWYALATIVMYAGGIVIYGEAWLSGGATL